MTHYRNAPIEMTKEDFVALGHQLIDRIGSFIETIHQRPVTSGESPRQIRKLLDTKNLPTKGSPAADVMHRAADLLFDHSLLNGHPKFFGYITSSAAPIGALADLLASAVNPNVGANILSPAATEIERQTIRWLTELIGLPANYDGILVSGGNMANFTAFRCALTARMPKNIKQDGIAAAGWISAIYCSKTTHLWVEKAAVLFGLGSACIRWIQTDELNRMDNSILESTILSDIQKGYKPIMLVGTAGDVSTGVVDNMGQIASLCKKYNIWFHIDGAYGIPAAALPGLRKLFDGIQEADSIALDPHKWLYTPLEAGCTLVKDPRHLTGTYSAHPDYYNFDNYEEEEVRNYYEYGFQNSRGFRALKVWLALQQVGKLGYIEMIQEDIKLSQLLFKLAESHPELDPITQNLSIATFRYVPPGFHDDPQLHRDYLNQLNKALLDSLQAAGEAFLSNAIIHGKYCLRACIVNFRTSRRDIEETIEIIVREGREIHKNLQTSR